MSTKNDYVSSDTTTDCTNLTVKIEQPLTQNSIQISTSDSTTALTTAPYNRCNFLYDAQLKYEQPNPYFVPRLVISFP